MKTYRVHIIRHGRTDANNDGRYIGVTDEPLNNEGRLELDALRDCGAYPDVDAVYSAPSLRCTETAKIIYPENEITVVENIKECNFGDFENKTAEQLKDNDIFKRWIAGEQGVAPPNGESTPDFVMRSVASFAAIIEDIMREGTRYSSIVTHGGVIMAVLSTCGLPQRSFADWRCDFGKGFTLLITPSLWMRSYKFEVLTEDYDSEENP